MTTEEPKVRKAWTCPLVGGDFIESLDGKIYTRGSLSGSWVEDRLCDRCIPLASAEFIAAADAWLAWWRKENRTDGLQGGEQGAVRVATLGDNAWVERNGELEHWWGSRYMGTSEHKTFEELIRTFNGIHLPPPAEAAEWARTHPPKGVEQDPMSSLMKQPLTAEDSHLRAGLNSAIKEQDRSSQPSLLNGPASSGGMAAAPVLAQSKAKQLAKQYLKVLHNIFDLTYAREDMVILANQILAEPDWEEEAKKHPHRLDMETVVGSYKSRCEKLKAELATSQSNLRDRMKEIEELRKERDSLQSIALNSQTALKEIRDRLKSQCSCGDAGICLSCVIGAALMVNDIDPSPAPQTPDLCAGCNVKDQI